MRRDYFTCVFLACIAGALCFVCFEPLYFKYGGIVVREFGLTECIASAVYVVFFLVAVPLYAGYRRKYWISVGLACYGLLAYLPGMLYPAQVYLTGDDASMVHILIALILRGIYGMVNAPFAALSRIWGDSVASSLSYWILPLSVLFPLLIKTYRFYRDAYVAEQLNPATVVSAPSNSKFDRRDHRREQKKEAKPEVLGTVISAPVRDLVKREESSPIEREEPKTEMIEAAKPAGGELVKSEAQHPQIRQPNIDPELITEKFDDNDDQQR
ncbi:MAG: hypothetical protein J5744_02505 [Oscillospiraceae bacterium]|nr:hypothetical protein [Oscillospiraceae bacterium]